MDDRPPRPSSENARRTMLANSRKDTAPEIAIRQRLHAAGLRYRVDYSADQTDPRRRTDIVFSRAKVAVFIDGCFWHGCPVHLVPPKRNAEYWGPKIERNMARDRSSTERLRESDWTVLRFWEHENPDAVCLAIIEQVRPQPRDPGPDV